MERLEHRLEQNKRQFTHGEVSTQSKLRCRLARAAVRHAKKTPYSEVFFKITCGARRAEARTKWEVNNHKRKPCFSVWLWTVPFSASRSPKHKRLPVRKSFFKTRVETLPSKTIKYCFARGRTPDRRGWV